MSEMGYGNYSEDAHILNTFLTLNYVNILVLFIFL